MKMVMINYNEALESEVMEALESNSIDGYTKWTKVLGKGRKSGPHLGTSIWPKANNALMVAAEDDRAAGIMRAIRELRQVSGHEGIKAFLLPIEDAT